MPVCPAGKYLENFKRKFRTWHHLGSAGNIGEDNLHLNVNWTWFANWDWHMHVTSLLQLYERTCAIIARALSEHMSRLRHWRQLCKIEENCSTYIQLRRLIVQIKPWERTLLCLGDGTICDLRWRSKTIAPNSFGELQSFNPTLFKGGFSFSKHYQHHKMFFTSPRPDTVPHS